MKKILVIAMALGMAFVTADAVAGWKHCPDGTKVSHGKTCPEPPPAPEPEPPKPGDSGWWNYYSNSNKNNNENVANGGSSTIKDSGNSTSTSHGGTGLGVGVGVGGAGGQGGSVGNVAGGSVGDVGNNSGNSTNLLGQNTSLDNVGNVSVGDVGSTSSVGNVGSRSNSSIGDTSNTNTLNNGSHSGGNTMTGGDVANTNTTSSNSGGNTLAGGNNAASADGSGNSRTEVNIDSADRSVTTYTAQTLLLPTIQTAAPALVANPALVVDRGACGPRMAKVQRDVNGTFIGLIFKSSIDLGVDDELVSAEEPYRYWTSPSGSQHVFGHQIVTYASVVGVAGSRAIGANGGETGGNYGGAGLSSGSSMQRTILRVQLQECEIQLQPREVPVLIEVERKRNNG